MEITGTVLTCLTYGPHWEVDTCTALVDHMELGRASKEGTSENDQTVENRLEKYFISNAVCPFVINIWCTWPKFNGQYIRKAR